VDEPDDLAGVPDRVAREARRDDGVDRTRADLGEVQAAPGDRRADEVEPVALDQGNRDEVRLDAAAPELLGEAADVPLGSSVRERRLDRQDEDARGFLQGDGLKAARAR
jgi:hypothetical protein